MWKLSPPLTYNLNEHPVLVTFRKVSARAFKAHQMCAMTFCKRHISTRQLSEIPRCSQMAGDLRTPPSRWRSTFAQYCRDSTEVWAGKILYLEWSTYFNKFYGKFAELVALFFELRLKPCYQVMLNSTQCYWKMVHLWLDLLLFESSIFQVDYMFCDLLYSLCFRMIRNSN